MSTNEEIWDKVKGYMLIDGNAFYFPHYIFVSESEKSMTISDEEELKPEDLENKSRIFDVVYDRVGNQIGEPLEVRKEGKYLKFSSKDN